jgi:hypothetical protein
MEGARDVLGAGRWIRGVVRGDGARTHLLEGKKEAATRLAKIMPLNGIGNSLFSFQP